MHGKQQHRAVEEGNGEHMEWVIEEVPVAEGERRGPIKVWENTEGHRLAPASHEHRANKAQY